MRLEYFCRRCSREWPAIKNEAGSFLIMGVLTPTNDFATLVLREQFTNRQSGKRGVNPPQIRYGNRHHDVSPNTEGGRNEYTLARYKSPPLPKLSKVLSPLANATALSLLEEGFLFDIR